MTSLISSAGNTPANTVIEDTATSDLMREKELSFAQIELTVSTLTLTQTVSYLTQNHETA